jgi:hypothetical protein
LFWSEHSNKHAEKLRGGSKQQTAGDLSGKLDEDVRKAA